MLKECRVLLNNDAVTVILYDGVKVQIPSIRRKADVVKVKDDGTYTVVPDDYKEPAAKPRARKKKEPAAQDKKSEPKEN